MSKKTKIIAFDMDGTIANLYQYPNWLEYLINEDTTPYAHATPLYDMAKLKTIVDKLKSKGWLIVIISWGSLNGSQEYTKRVKAAKIEWLKKYNFPYDKIHVVKYGTLKHGVCRKYTQYGILIDDNEQVRKSWKLGQALEPDNKLLRTLEEMIA